MEEIAKEIMLPFGGKFISQPPELRSIWIEIELPANFIAPVPGEQICHEADEFRVNVAILDAFKGIYHPISLPGKFYVSRVLGLFICLDQVSPRKVSCDMLSNQPFNQLNSATSIYPDSFKSPFSA
jgi:hypothetical protein